MYYLKHESEHLYEDILLNRRLIGWEHLIRDKCVQNDLMDVKTINIPDLEKRREDCKIYIFADYLKPGYHQILIYDPL